MTKIEIKTVVESLIDTFLKAGKISIELRKEGLTKQLKEDSTPVSNGDIEVNKIISNVPAISNVSNRYDRTKIIESAFIRKSYVSDNLTSSERAKLVSRKYSLLENEFITLGDLKINIERS